MSSREPAGETARRLIAHCLARRWRLATAESCTGGLIAATLTGIAGASDIFEGAVVAYDNRVKQALLGVGAETLETHGAVSRETALAMARGCRAALHADLALSVTGIAGPGGGTATKPVGLVHLAACSEANELHRRCVFAGDRLAVREAAVRAALRLGIEASERSRTRAL